jgi:hypothetical protein
MKVGIREIGPQKTGASQARTNEARSQEFGAVKHCPCKIALVKLVTREVNITKIRSSKLK